MKFKDKLDAELAVTSEAALADALDEYELSKDELRALAKVVAESMLGTLTQIMADEKIAFVSTSQTVADVWSDYEKSTKAAQHHSQQAYNDYVKKQNAIKQANGFGPNNGYGQVIAGSNSNLYASGHTISAPVAGSTVTFKRHHDATETTKKLSALSLQDIDGPTQNILATNLVSRHQPALFGRTVNKIESYPGPSEQLHAIHFTDGGIVELTDKQMMGLNSEIFSRLNQGVVTMGEMIGAINNV
jgi:hypothetical protein